MPRITLIGYRGSGKSTVAASLAEALGCGWRDTDAVLEARLGRTIAEFIGARGEAAFRDAEAVVLGELLDMADGVLATGGGVVLRPENRGLLRSRGRPVVWLRVTAAVARVRLAADPTTAARRPALAGADPVAEVDEAITARAPLYRECADFIVDVDDASPSAVVAEVLACLSAAARGEWCR